MESKHTKGTWKIDKPNFEVINIVTEQKFICEIPCPIYENEDTYSRGKEAQANAERIVHCVNSYDELVKQNERLKQALNTILNLGRPNGDYAAAFSKTKTIANNALNTLTVKEDGNNEAKAL